MMVKEKRFTFRLPADLHARLVKLASEQNRSLNAQIVHLLKLAMKKDKASNED